MTYIPYQITRPSYHQGFARSASVSVYPQGWDGLIGDWDPELGITGDIVRSFSDHKNNGVLTSFDLSTAWIIDGGNRFLSYDATNDYVSVPNFKRPSLITVIAWIKTSTNIEVQIASADDSGSGSQERTWQLRLDVTTGFARFIVFVGSIPFTAIVGATDLTDNALHQVVGVYDGEEARLYEDAVLTSSDNSMSGLLDSGTGMALGRISDERDDGPADSKIGQVLVFNRPKTANEIRTNFVNRMAFLQVRQPVWKASAAVGGRIMSSLTNYGGLAGKGGIAGIGGGLAS